MQFLLSTTSYFTLVELSTSGLVFLFVRVRRSVRLVGSDDFYPRFFLFNGQLFSFLLHYFGLLFHVFGTIFHVDGYFFGTFGTIVCSRSVAIEVVTGQCVSTYFTFWFRGVVALGHVGVRFRLGTAMLTG